MKLHCLGVNGPFPDSGGATSGYLAEAGEGLFQLDLGSGVLGALTARTPPEDLSALLLSHWHYDHVADVPVLMYRLQALNRTLPVYAPEDPSSPVFALVSGCPNFELNIVRPGDSFSLCGVEIKVNSARHPVPTVGYRLTAGGKSLGYTGDTNTLSSLDEDYQDCDLLLADGLFPREMWTAEKPHLSASLAAEIATRARVGRLVITHLNPFVSRTLLLMEARRTLPGVLLAEAGMTLEL